MTEIPKATASHSSNPFLVDDEPPPESAVAMAPALDTDAGRFVQQLAADMAAGEFDLPPFPDTALRIRTCINDPNADNHRLAAIISGEPALAARLMRMANSVLLRRGPIEVTDIPTAIFRVGLDMVQNVALSHATRATFSLPPGSIGLEDIERLRKNSITVAAYAYVIADNVVAALKPEEAMLAGLLHAVGKLYIYTRANEYPSLFSNRQALEKLVSQWHTGVARAIVEAWNFPESIQIAVDEQEVRVRDLKQAPDLSDVLFIANLLARTGKAAAAHLGDVHALARLNWDVEDLVEVLEENDETLASMIQAMR